MGNQDSSPGERLYSMDTDDYKNTGALELRLETKRNVERFELFLKGKKFVEKQNPRTGEIEVGSVEIGDPLCNEDGVRYLVAFFEGIINPANAQGNYERKEYYRYLRDIHVRLARLLNSRGPSWSISTSDQRVILSKIVMEIRLFLTRPIDNEERLSYSNIKSVENRRIDVEKSKGGWF